MAMGCASWGQLAYVLIFKCCKNGQVSTMNRGVSVLLRIVELCVFIIVRCRREPEGILGSITGENSMSPTQGTFRPQA